jgi:hypothetical protein
MYYITAKVKDVNGEEQCFLAYSNTKHYWSTWNVRLFYTIEGAKTTVSLMGDRDYFRNSELDECVDVDSIKVREFKEFKG